MASGIRVDSLRDRDLAHWLEQRLDSSSDTWTASRNLSTLITRELLANIPSCFVDLRTHAKLNILMSILYLAKRSAEQWRDEIEDILSLACQDTDEWVQTTAELLKEYPTTSGISFNMENDGSQFTKTLQELRKILRRQMKGPSAQVLPLDAAYMNKQAVQSTWGIPVQQPSSVAARYFSLKRKPKAAAQRIEFLQKSADAATQMKYKNGPLSSFLPIRHKSTVRKMDDDAPLKGIPTQNPTKSVTARFRPGSKPINRQVSVPTANSRRLSVGLGVGSGVKLIDINDTPQALEKKRKTMEAEEKAAKKAAKEEQKRQREEEKTHKKLQRDLKAQRSLQQNESRISESSAGFFSDNGQGTDEESKTRLSNFVDSVAHPTPDYAAELFEDSLSGPRIRGPIASNLGPGNVSGSGALPFSMSLSTAPSTTTNALSESHLAAAALMQTTPIAPAPAGASETIGNAPTVPYFFTPATPLMKNIASVGINSISLAASNAPAGKVPLDVAQPSQGTKSGSKKSGAEKRIKAQSRKTNDAEAVGGRSKKRKVDAETTDAAPLQESIIIQNATGMTVRPLAPQEQQPSILRFQYGGVTATPSPTLATRGIAQMANMFLPQQRIQQLVPSSQQQQGAGQRTIVVLQQPTQIPSPVATSSPVNFYNAAPLPAGVASRVVIQQQPAQTIVPGQMLASFTPAIVRQTTPLVGPNASSTATAANSDQIRPQAANQQSAAQQSAGTSDDSKKPTFTITKDVMLKAQEMFRTANKLSRPEKALILGFMAGNRENPCPQMGRVLTVRLSENQDAQTQPDGSTRSVMIETYFQMNYDTGEWKQIRKIRPLREDEGQAA